MGSNTHEYLAIAQDHLRKALVAEREAAYDTVLSEVAEASKYIDKAVKHVGLIQNNAR